MLGLHALTSPPPPFSKVNISKLSIDLQARLRSRFNALTVPNSANSLLSKGVLSEDSIAERVNEVSRC